tara:strand:- start:578 stop:970 length:393 start_codon:yes stop_codon:yes gene_type:complete
VQNLNRKIMGLDQSAYKTRLKINGTDFKTNEDDKEIAYWRKHPNLHGMMEKIYREKGGKSKQFNVVPVELTKEDLIKLGETIINNKLPKTEGFFFGRDSDEHYFEKDIEFLEKAKNAIEEGFQVYYTSWW